MRVSHPTPSEPDVDMTSMLDVVFIMLIFFIVTSSFMKESSLSFSRPNDRTTPTKGAVTSALITLQSNGELSVGQRAIDIRSLPAWVENQRVANKNLSVLLQAHAQASTDNLMSVINQLTAAGVEKVSVATFE